MDDPTPTQAAQPRAAAPLSSVVGDLRLHEFRSKIFRNTRWLRVWLPPGYEAAESQSIRYPVLYLNDGQNLFERATAFAGVEWQVDETADWLIRSNLIPPMILVGIDNMQKARIREYVPYRSLNPPILRPQGKQYPDFLLDEIMPFVQHQYRVALGPANTGLGGSSLGALISLYTVMTRAGVFGRLLLESPSLFLSYRSLLKETKNFRRWPQRIFLAIGTKEVGRDDRDRAVLADVKRLEQNLRRAGLDDDRLRVEIEEGAVHSEATWARRFPGALRFLFG
jgi:predicted alpha/beta superfamily hydrolase